MKLVWSERAMEDRIAIFDYIEMDSPQAAAMIDHRMDEQSKVLAQFPEIGRHGRIEGTREFVIQGTPYVLAYCMIPDAVRVLRVLH